MTRLSLRTLLIALVVAGVLPAATAATAVPPAAASTRRILEGTLRLLSADTVEHLATADAHEMHGRSEDHVRPVLVVGEKAYFLRGAKAEHLRPNRRVRVAGALSGRDLATASVNDLGAAPGAVPTSGTTRVLVMLAHWAAPDSTTPASAASQMFADTNAWYRDASYTALGQTGDVTPWMRIAGPAGGQCYADHLSTMSQAKSAATALGYDLAAYDNFVLYAPNNAWQTGSDCNGYAGWAYVGAENTWLNGYLDRRATVHEQGHNYGLYHAHSDMCTGGGTSGTCTWLDYGDDYDAMGSSDLVGHFSGPAKNALGWMTGRTVDLTSGGSTTLAPLAADPAGVRSAVVRISASRSYWVEYRQPVDFDAALPAYATDGVLIRLLDPGVGGDAGANLLDVVPGDGIAVTSSTLAPGQSWTSSEGYRFTTTSASATGAGLTVAAPAKPPSAPLGVAATASGSTATLTWSAPASTGGAAITGYKVARDGVDANGTGPWSTTVSASARSYTFRYLKPGSTYRLSVQAVNATGTGASASAIVVAGAPAVPMMPTSVMATSLGSTGTLTWAPPTSTGGTAITAYKVARDGTDTYGTGPWSTTVPVTSRGYTFRNLRAGTTYRLSVQAVNAAGAGPAATASVVAGVTTAPLGVRVSVAATTHSATLTWAPPQSSTSAVTGYQVGRNGTDLTGSGPWSTTTRASTRTWTFSNLRPGTTYTLTVRAVTAQGAGAAASGSAVMP